MALDLVKLVSNSLTAPSSTSTKVGRSFSENPFGNAYSNVRPLENSSYMKNTPVKGGYFAGYHNGVPNIVGQRLFIEA
ncbi:hypothetical protein IJV79_03485 [bacterium]|nr:hypothetical protein [bacterium]